MPFFKAGASEESILCGRKMPGHEAADGSKTDASHNTQRKTATEYSELQQTGNQTGHS